MPKSVVLPIALVLVVGGAGAAVWFGRADPEGEASGSSSRTDAIWSRLGDYRGSYLRTWAGALDAPASAPSEVLDAFNELAFAVTGPTGFWRKTVPQQWLGCADNGETPPCQKLAELEVELKKWDAFQKAISALDEKQARVFLATNHEKIMAYLDTYVPPEPSATGMKVTGFFKKYLESIMSDVL